MLEAIYVSFIWMVGILYNNVPLCSSAELPYRWHGEVSHNENVYLPLKSVNAATQGLTFLVCVYLDLRK